MKNRGSWIAIALLTALPALAADTPKQEEQGYVIMPAAVWAVAAGPIEQQQRAIELLRERLKKNTCGKPDKEA